MIKILFLAASPLDTNRLNLDEEARAIDQSLRQGGFRDQFEILSHLAVGTDDLQALLLRHMPDIVHFSGHGSPAGSLVLQDPAGRAVAVSPPVLGNLFRILKDQIRCVVLTACYSEAQAKAIAEYIDCVVGVSNDISDIAAISFVSAFYSALGYGRDVQTAFELGTTQLQFDGHEEQARPILVSTLVDPSEIFFVPRNPQYSDSQVSSIDIITGNFIGRDSSNINYFSTAGNVQSETEEESSLRDRIIWQNEVSQLGDQIKRLKGRVVRLALTNEEFERFETIIQRNEQDKIKRPLSERLLYVASSSALEQREKPELQDIMIVDKTKEYSRILFESEHNLTDTTRERFKFIQREITMLADDLNLEIGRLHATFNRHIASAEATVELFSALVLQIGHETFRSEADIHLTAVNLLWRKLDSDGLGEGSIDVLSDKAHASIRRLAEIERRKEVVNRLITLDRGRSTFTSWVVICYIALMIVVVSWGIATSGMAISPTQLSLQDRVLPLINVPLSVILWSLIGSFAAMILQFNRQPVYDFGNTVKWMLTRPVQGVVLGSAFYLVFVSGLFLLTSGVAMSGQQSKADEVILVLSFLVGFSDRFADNVFNTLLNRYSQRSPDSQRIEKLQTEKVE